MMVRVIFPVLRYVGALAGACVLAGGTSFPFLKPGDFSVLFQATLMAAFSGCYTLAFTPIVIMTEIMARRMRSHHLLPLWAIPVFGACFPVVGFVLLPRTWWPEEPADMDGRQIAAVLVPAAFALGTGVLAVCVSSKRAANQAVPAISASGPRRGNAETPPRPSTTGLGNHDGHQA